MTEVHDSMLNVAGFAPNSEVCTSTMLMSFTVEILKTQHHGDLHSFPNLS
jgi:hypothetical protein